MITFKEATHQNLEAVIDLLANDELGKNRENNTRPLPSVYQEAFNRIMDDPNAFLIVGLYKDEIIAVAQLNILHYLTYQGGSRALIEGVRVHQNHRSQGVGKQLFEHVIKLAREKSCHLIQLTTDKSRPSAYQFYERLGFQPSHEGFKLHL